MATKKTTKKPAKQKAERPGRVELLAQYLTSGKHTQEELVSKLVKANSKLKESETRKSIRHWLHLLELVGVLQKEGEKVWVNKK